MDEYAQLRTLLDLAEAAGIAIRRAPADDDHPGGAMVRLGGREILFLDPAASVADRIAVAAAALKGRPDIEGRFLPPKVRRLIDGY